MSRMTVGLGVLSWRASETLSRTLNSYNHVKLSSRFDECLIYFNDLDDEAADLATAHGWAYTGGPNQGIAGGMEALAKELGTDFVLLVQNDCPVCVAEEAIDYQLEIAMEMLVHGRVDMVRMRHRFLVGEGFSSVEKFLRHYAVETAHPEFRIDQHRIAREDLNPSLRKTLRKTFRPMKAARLIGRGIYVEHRPEHRFPDQIRRLDAMLVVSSEYLNFTDQSIFMSRKWFIDILMAYVNQNPSSRILNGFQVPEICLRCRWWRDQNFRIGQGNGMFTHQRFDGSFRAGHPAWEPCLVAPTHQDLA